MGRKGTEKFDALFIIETTNGKRTRRFVSKSSVLAKKPLIKRCERILENPDGTRGKMCYRTGWLDGRRGPIMIEWENLSAIQRRKPSIQKGYRMHY
jgi:hypothetical protein